jgi:hypothetical protein
VPTRTPSRSATWPAVRSLGEWLIAPEWTAESPPAGSGESGAILVDLASRIPVGRLAQGPHGLPWYIDAVWASRGPLHLPCLLLRPCWVRACRGALVARVVEGWRPRRLDELLLRPRGSALCDPLPYGDEGGTLTVGLPTEPLIDLSDPDLAPAERRLLLDAAPWSLLVDDHAAALGLGELAGMDPVDAAYAAIAVARLGPKRAGRGHGRQVASVEASVIDALVRAGMPAGAAVEVVRCVVGAAGTQPLMDGYRSALRSRQGVPDPVLVPDPAPQGHRDLRDWLSEPRTARMVWVVACGRPKRLTVALSPDESFRGWVDAQSADLRSRTEDMDPGDEPPAGSAPEDLDWDGTRLRVRRWTLG